MTNKKQERAGVPTKKIKPLVLISDSDYYITALFDGYAYRSNHRTKNTNGDETPCITDLQPNTLIRINRFTIASSNDYKIGITVHSFSIVKIPLSSHNRQLGTPIDINDSEK